MRAAQQQVGVHLSRDVEEAGSKIREMAALGSHFKDLESSERGGEPWGGGGRLSKARVGLYCFKGPVWLLLSGLCWRENGSRSREAREGNEPLRRSIS